MLKILSNMGLFSITVKLAVLLCCATASVLEKKPSRVLSFPNAGVKNENNAFEIYVNPTNGPRIHGLLGMSLPGAVGSTWTSCELEDPSDTVCAKWGDFAQLRIKESKHTGDPDRCMRIEWITQFARELTDCYDLDSTVHWYGGAEVYYEIWPIETRGVGENPYVSENYNGVLEYYWVQSNGAAIVLDPDTPLYFSLNTTYANKVCFTARDQTPFAKRSPLKLNYEWCAGTDIKDVHQYVRNTFFEKPQEIADEGMLVRPFWSTWAEYKTDVNQTNVLDYARKVVSEGFANSSHIQIDDDWETCYGDEAWNPTKFPDPKAMIQEIKDMGLRLTLWVHPFVNYECPMFDEGFQKGYFVKSARGKTGLTSWWQGANSGIIDITNPDAAKWWADRLRKLQEDYGIDSFKFDAGETGLLPASPSFSGDETGLWPLLYTTKYVEFCAQFGGLVETRTAFQNQKEAMFIRFQDKDSQWGYDNGLKSMIPTLFQFGINGYSFALPDMIGGNAYGDRPSKELYIRWVQLNIFMPSVQFSLVPWNYDAETVRICRDVMAQREKYRDEILAAARQTVVDGSPMNRPLWWVSPTDTVTFLIDDEYMLGDTILVAPVVDEGAVSRDIYLPQGTWTAAVDSVVYTGPQWLRNYPAPLDVVPFFVKSA